MTALPVLAAGELEALGFDEVEPGLVEDTQENRKRIYQLEGSWQFERILDENGQPVGLIRPLKPEMLTERRERNYEIYRDILKNPRDPWSDFLPPEDLPLDIIAPRWILYKLRAWRQHEAEGTLPTWDFPVRCEARRYDGTRCWLWAGRPSEIKLCKAHVSAAAGDNKKALEYGRNRVISMLPGALDNLEYLAFNAESEPVKLKANTEILDRAGLRAGLEIDITGSVELTDPTQQVKERISTLQQRLLEAQKALEPAPENIQEAEVVTDDTE